MQKSLREPQIDLLQLSYCNKILENIIPLFEGEKQHNYNDILV